MKVAIRADASLAIGSGHVVRCLALADALRAQGATVEFLCRELLDALAALIAGHGHALTRLPARPDGVDVAGSQDAADTLAALAGGADWLVVDHYRLDADWERRVRNGCDRLLALDDLGRTHAADLLLDQNLPVAQRYDACLAGACVPLLGPGHALLRAQFAAARVGLERDYSAVRRVLVSCGGGDAGGMTLRLLDVLAVPEFRHLSVDVVVAAAHPQHGAIAARCRGLPGWSVHVQVEDMAALMVAADLYVGAGGSVTWERCCLGLPGIVVPVADNQRQGARDLAERGLVALVDVPEAELAEALSDSLRGVLADAARRARMGRVGMTWVDGQGAPRVADVIRRMTC